MLLAASMGLAFVLPPGGASPAGGVADALGRFHVLALHLPLGALVLVVLLEAVAIVRPHERDRMSAALDVAAPFLFVSAAVAFVLGVLLAAGGGQPPKLVALHRGVTMASLVACGAATFARGRATGAFRGLLVLTAVLMSVGAHFGGTLTHGEGFLRGVETKADAAKPPPPEPPGNDAKVLADVLQPLLDAHCVECHGERRAKGRLRLDTVEAMRAGGKHGPAYVARSSAKSLVVTRMHLPEDDDEHMPPGNRKAPPAGMAELLAAWIDRGADPELRVRDVLLSEPARALLTSPPRD